MPNETIKEMEVAEGEVAPNVTANAENPDGATGPAATVTEYVKDAEYNEAVNEKRNVISRTEELLHHLSTELKALENQGTANDKALKKLDGKVKDLSGWKDEKGKQDKSYEELNGKDSLFTKSIMQGMLTVGLLAGAIGALLGGPFIMFFLAFGLSAGLTYAVARPFIINFRGYLKKREAQQISESTGMKKLKADTASFNANHEKLQRDYERVKQDLNREQTSLDAMIRTKLFTEEKKSESTQAIKNGSQVLSAVSPLKPADYSKMSDAALQTTYSTVQDSMKESINAKDTLEIVDSPIEFLKDDKLHLPAKIYEDIVIDQDLTEKKEEKKRDINQETADRQVKEFYDELFANQEKDSDSTTKNKEESNFDKAMNNLGKDLNSDVVTTPQAVSTAPVVEEESDELKHK